MAHTVGELRARTSTRRSLIVLALLAYVPLLTSQAGRLPADTKLGLSLDPARLMATSLHSWDTSQFAGWVPHQAISFLWPSGPFYFLFDHLGVPAWVTQRLFVGTILFAAGAGVLRFTRHRGYSVGAAFVAALIYQASPYVLPYVSRTSVMLLPWAAVGWLLLLIERATDTAPGAWRRPTALFALIVATVGGVNLTALAMVAAAPVLHLVLLARTGRAPARRAVLTAARVGAASLAVSLWWMAMLSVQGKYGAKVLGYSETLEAVSTTATAPEVLRGMGYWLAYVHAPSGTTTTAATPYMTSTWLLLVGFALVLVCAAALAVLRFTERWLVAAMLLAGVVLAVGVHPITEPSALMSGIAHASRSTLALSLRSSTRAVPLIVLAFALSAAALVDATARLRVPWRALVAPALVVLALANQPSLFDGSMVDPALLHDERPPTQWYDAARVVNSGDSEQRIVQLPGVESQVFTWGYTVDPPLPSLTDRQVITRDWLPLGTPAAMDLFYAYDDRYQAGLAEPSAVAPMSRLLGSDTIWLALDANSQRFGSARAGDVAAVLDRAGDVTRLGGDDAHVALYRVQSSIAITRAASRTVVVFGSGDGIVDAAGAGLLRGDEALVYAADLTDAELTTLAQQGATFIVTDSNRDRAHQWRGAQDVWGFTETGGPASDLLRFDPQDARLPVFAAQRADDQTVALPDGGLVVQATSYGSPVRSLPEHRPAAAVDGDADTSWMVGIDHGPTVGEQIRLSSAAEGLRIVQSTGAEFITRIGIDSAGRHRSLELDASSRTVTGQTVLLSDGEGPVTVTIEAVSGDGPVGFAELTPTPHPETVRVPELRVSPTQPDGTPFAVVLTRLRTTSSERSDEEPTLRRAFTTPAVTTPHWQVRVSARAGQALPPAGCTTGPLTLDGAPVELELTTEARTDLAAGRAATLDVCGGRAIEAGRHVLVSTAESLSVDRVVLTSYSPAGSPTAGSADGPVAHIERHGDHHAVTVQGCPTGCWLIFGEGFSSGWSATSADATLGRHLPLSGGFNGWWVQPAADGTAHVTLEWAGQGRVDAALLVSSLAAAVLLVAACWPRRRRTHQTVSHLTPTFAQVSVRGTGSSTVTTAFTAIAALALVALVVSPKWAVLCVPVAAASVFVRRPRVLAVGGLALLALGSAAVVAAQFRHGYPADFIWPTHFERWHRPMLTGVVLLAVSALGPATTDRRPATP